MCPVNVLVKYLHKPRKLQGAFISEPESIRISNLKILKAATMTCSARVCLLMAAVFLLQEVGSDGQDITGLLQQNLDIMTKQVDNLRQLIQAGKTNTDSSTETHEQKIHEKSIQSNDASAILRAISPLRQAFQEEKSFHRKNYYKLETDMSRLDTDIGSVRTDTKQVMAVMQNSVQGLEEARKEQATLRQTVDAVVKENKQFWSSQNQSTVANSQKIEWLVQRVEGLKQEILTTVDDVVAKAGERHINKYKTLIQEAMDNREKCQSGDGVGPHSFNPGPSYPYTVTVFFQPHFKKTPSLVHGLKVLDSDYRSNVRMSAHIIELTNTHFKMTINRWGDTVMYGAVFSWMACPK